MTLSDRSKPIIVLTNFEGVHDICIEQLYDESAVDNKTQSAQVKIILRHCFN